MATRSDWDRLRLGMDLLSKEVAAELLRFPAPARGDLYNQLLELRRLLPMELTRLDIALENNSITVDDFIRSSPCRDILTALLAKPARP